ncbi:MAG: DUF4175 family protein [Rhodovarius sp.]|nr:DUF4175 family protein [Rhodovarius sp.]
MGEQVMTPARLSRRRRLARLVLLWERLWPSLWPVLGVSGLFLLLALLGLPALLPPWLHVTVLAAFALALAAVLHRALREWRLPTAAEAERRLELASGLAHQPLAALRDRPAGSDAVAAALWRVHQMRMAGLVQRLRVGRPRPGLAARDPRALRAALLLALLAAVVIAGPDAPDRLARAFTPAFSPPPAALAERIEGWITPPAYTGAPPIFLPAGGGEAMAPAGSRLSVSVSGRGGTAPQLLFPGGTLPLQMLDARSFAVEAELLTGGQIRLMREGRPLVEWSLSLRADTPPLAVFPEPPARSQRGLQLRIPWRAEDDWGVHALRLEARLKARPEAPPLELTIPLPPGNPRAVRGLLQPDLSAHPWAGLAVSLRLVATDGAGQTGASAEAELVLPERSFTHPVARALVAIRRDLSLAPEARAAARRALEELAADPDAFEGDITTALGLRVARNRLAQRHPEAVAEVQELLWDMALALEEGKDARTARALEQARQALREALEEAERQRREGEDNAAALAEAQRRIEELREAIRRHLEALAERLRRENAENLSEAPQNRLTDQREINRRTDRMRDATRENRLRDAQRELAELEEMLRALEEGRGPRSESAQRQQQRSRGQQQMSVVQDMIRRQGELLDAGQRRAEAEAQRQSQLRRIPGRPTPQPDISAQEAQEIARAQQEEARRQRALRRALGELMQQYGDLTGEVPEALGRADQAMREAQEALRSGADARDAQQRALRHLQEGGRQMAQQLQRQFGSQGSDGDGDPDEADMAGLGEDGGDEPGSEQQLGEGRDPLGRRSREQAGSADHGSDTKVPEEAEVLRTRRIQEELRRRGAERDRPVEELEYIDRLLRRF